MQRCWSRPRPAALAWVGYTPEQRAQRTRRPCQQTPADPAPVYFDLTRAA